MNQKKIAEIAGVSQSTVSKVLAGSKEISGDIADRVWAVARDMGYFDKKSKIRIDYKDKKYLKIAVICPEIDSLYYANAVTGIINEVEARGGEVSVYITKFDEKRQKKIIKMIETNKDTDGLISLYGLEFDCEISIPVVLPYNPHAVKYNNIDVISNDDSEAFDVAIEYLFSIGHRRIGFVGEPLSNDRYLSFYHAMKKRDLRVNRDDVYIIKKRFDEIGLCAGDEIAKKKSMPTAFVTAYDEIGIALIHRLYEVGINVPEDVSVIGVNDILFSKYCRVPLTTVKVPIEEQCVHAVDLIYKRIYGKTEMADLDFSRKSKLIIRESTRAVNN